ncbi:MAG: cell division initiation protein [Microbacterium sp.]|nr:cell division initiation protein [Microbacterium sp.]
MADQQVPDDEAAGSPFDELIAGVGSGSAPGGGHAFSTAFRGYERAEVDAAIADLNGRLAALTERLSGLEEDHRRRQADADAHSQETIESLRADLAAAEAQAADAQNQVQVLSEGLVGADAEGDNPHRFEEILRVAEDQASLVLKNATVQGDRLLEAAREEIRVRREEAQVDADAIRSAAQHDAQQVRLRIDTELTAHQAQIEREAAHAAEKVAQAEQEAAAIRSEAEKGAAALRSMVARETTDARTEAEDAVKELRLRALEFEESLTRRQDDAQQEFLALHNQAVAHAERITQDANEQVAASLEHAQRVSAKAEDFDRLMRAQATQIEADAHLRSREHLDRAHAKAQRIIDTVTAHSQSVLRDAEDRTRQLRWQQHQLTSFMSEVKELIRPEVSLDGADAADDTDAPVKTPARKTTPKKAKPEASGAAEPETDADQPDELEQPDETMTVQEHEEHEEHTTSEESEPAREG